MSQPFQRAIAMFSLIAAAMGDSAKLAAIGPYESRGKGKGMRSRSRSTTAQVKRASVKAGNVAKHRRLA